MGIQCFKNFVSEAEEAQTFNRRLGYLAVDLKEYGELRFGKQWSVYSDISLMTSVFNIYGSSSTGTFNFRTDGGQVGTGRASKAVSYRKSWGNFDIGLQAKLIKNRQLSINDNEVDITAKDSFGVSLKHGFLDKKFTLGLAFNEIDIQGDEIEAIGYDGGRSWSAVFGMEIKFETITIAVTLNQSKNHEISDEDIVFDAIGGEASLVYKINEFYSFLIGMNKLDDRDDLEGDFKKELYITGIDFKLHDEVNLYSEIQLNESRQSNGEKLDSSYGFGGTFRF